MIAVDKISVCDTLIQEYFHYFNVIGCAYEEE
jgi:hypothetical protein